MKRSLVLATAGSFLAAAIMNATGHPAAFIFTACLFSAWA